MIRTVTGLGWGYEWECYSGVVGDMIGSVTGL